VIGSAPGALPRLAAVVQGYGDRLVTETTVRVCEDEPSALTMNPEPATRLTRLLTSKGSTATAEMETTEASTR